MVTLKDDRDAGDAEVAMEKCFINRNYSAHLWSLGTRPKHASMVDPAALRILPTVTVQTPLPLFLSPLGERAGERVKKAAGMNGYFPRGLTSYP